ncbi:MAG: hypothetical protein ACAI44_21545, partial [Candidatus Sericytochromatia bacterium]
MSSVESRSTGKTGPLYPLPAAAQQETAMPPAGPQASEAGAGNPDDRMQIAARAAGSGTDSVAFVEGLAGAEYAVNLVNYELGVDPEQDRQLDKGIDALMALYSQDPGQMQQTLAQLKIMSEPAFAAQYGYDPALMAQNDDGCAKALQQAGFAGGIGFETLKALSGVCEPAGQLLFSQSPQLRSTALVELAVAKDRQSLKMSEKLKPHLSEQDVQAMALYSGTYEISQQDSFLTGAVQELMNKMAANEPGTSLTNYKGKDVALMPMDLFLGRLFLQKEGNPPDVQGLNRIFLKLQSGQSLNAAEEKTLLANGLKLEQGKVYALNAEGKPTQALKATDIAQLGKVLAIMATPPDKMSREAQLYLQSYTEMMTFQGLTAKLTGLLSQQTAALEKLDLEIAQDEQELAGMDDLLQDLDGLLKRFEMDNLSPADLKIMEKLGIDIKAGVWVKNKF